MHIGPVALIAFTLVAAAPAAAQQTAVTVIGPGGSRSFAAADLARLPRAKAQVTIHGEAHAFEGVPLTHLLTAAGAPQGETLRGKALAGAVRIKARDGYEVVLSLADADPAFRTRPVLLADRVDGKPIGEQDGPFRLVVPDDLKPARSARQVERITVEGVR